MNGEWFLTLTGRTCLVENPRPEDICLEDVAGALSRICRFGGMISRHYSVAQHSVLVSRLCHPDYALRGLLHDAAEAYLGDVISPLKRSIGRPYRDLTNTWNVAIARAFGLGTFDLVTLPEDVKRADHVAYATEHRDLRPGLPRHAGMAQPDHRLISPWPANVAFVEFHKRWLELQHQRLDRQAAQS